MTVREIGCCGAYCRTCRALLPAGNCRGCKLGYGDGGRDVNQAKCRMKLCCFRDHNFETCADCSDYNTCLILREFYGKNGFKYRKYREALEFIRANGYEGFLAAAANWRGPYGKLPGE